MGFTFFGPSCTLCLRFLTFLLEQTLSDFNIFWQKCYQESRQCKDALLSYFRYLVLLHCVVKQEIMDIASFHLMFVCCIASRDTKRIEIVTWLLFNHPSFTKWSSVMYAAKSSKKRNTASSHVFCSYSSLSWCSSPCQKWDLFFIEPSVEVNEQYCWDALLSQQMIGSIRHIAGDQFCLLVRRRTGWHIRCTTQSLLLHHETRLAFYWAMPSSNLHLNPVYHEI